jgi:predicted HTH transcriptional regulator
MPLHASFFPIETRKKTMVILFKEKLKISIEKPKDEGLNEGLKLIIQFIAKKPGIQARELSELLNDRSLKTIERQISKLIGRNYIERKGSKKTGGYFLKE